LGLPSRACQVGAAKRIPIVLRSRRASAAAPKAWGRKPPRGLRGGKAA
jgi:hypothetical protein